MPCRQSLRLPMIDKVGARRSTDGACLEGGIRPSMVLATPALESKVAFASMRDVHSGVQSARTENEAGVGSKNSSKGS